MGKCILLNGSGYSVFEIKPEEYNYEHIQKLLGAKKYLGYHTFGTGYTTWWQEERNEKTSMEITVMAGASAPIFINSKVIITRENDETGELIDIDMDELKKHFNTDNAYWALLKNFLR